MDVLRMNLSLMGIAVLCATASFAQQVKTDYDRSVDFSQYKTYTWEHVHTQNPLWVDRIKAAVNSALATKVWTEVESGGSVSIVGMEMTRSHQTLDTYYDGFGGGWRWRGWGNQFGEATTTTNTYEVGTLVVDSFDSRTKRLIWRGSASDSLSDKSDTNIRSAFVARRLSQTTYKLHPYERNYEHAITRSKGLQELTLPAKLELVQGNLS